MSWQSIPSGEHREQLRLNAGFCRDPWHRIANLQRKYWVFLASRLDKVIFTSVPQPSQSRDSVCRSWRSCDCSSRTRVWPPGNEKVNVSAPSDSSHHDGESQPAQQHHKHAANVLNTQGVSLRVFALVLKIKWILQSWWQDASMDRRDLRRVEIFNHVTPQLFCHFMGV